MDWIASNASGSISNFDSDRHYTMAAGSGSCRWMYSQPTPQTYVRFLSETGHTEIQKQMPYDVLAHFPTLGLPNPSQLEEYMRPHNGGDFVTSVTGLEQLGVQEQKLNEEFSHAFETYSHSRSVSEPIGRWINHIDDENVKTVIYLEEHGNYFVQDQMLNGPLEKMMGKLISAYHSAATELLQSRGLVVLPMTFAEGLLESMGMLQFFNLRHCD